MRTLLLLLLLFSLGCEQEQVVPEQHTPIDAGEQITGLVHSVYGDRAVTLRPMRDGIVRATFLDHELALTTLQYEFDRGRLEGILVIERKTP